MWDQWELGGVIRKGGRGLERKRKVRSIVGDLDEGARE